MTVTNDQTVRIESQQTGRDDQVSLTFNKTFLLLQIVKYKTNQATDLKKFIALNASLMSQMQNKAMGKSEDGRGHCRIALTLRLFS